MIKERIGFGWGEREIPEYMGFVGEWVRIYGTDSRTYAGKVTNIKDGMATLNPFQKTIATKKGPREILVKKKSLVPIVGLPVEPVSQRELEIICEQTNNLVIKNFEEGKPKIFLP